MMNMTARLAIKIRYLPEFTFQWSDTQPQLSRQALTINFYLPNKDAMGLQQRGVQYLEEFLVEHFSDLEHLKRYVQTVEPLHPPQKSEVVPMKVLFKDEKLKTDTIDILSQLITDANLEGTPQVCTISSMYMHVHVF